MKTLNIPVNGSPDGLRYVRLNPPSVASKVQFRETFHPKPAPTTKTFRLLYKLGRQLAILL